MLNVMAALLLIVILTVSFLYVEAVNASNRKRYSQNYLTRVHVTGEVKVDGQRCKRCGTLLVSVVGGVPYDESPRGKFLEEGKFVGTLEFRDGRKTGVMFDMDHDADMDEESEEVVCAL